MVGRLWAGFATGGNIGRIFIFFYKNEPEGYQLASDVPFCCSVLIIESLSF